MLRSLTNFDSNGKNNESIIWALKDINFDVGEREVLGIIGRNGAAVSTIDPEKIHFFERDVVAFNIVDKMEGDSARGDYIGNMPGIVRPMLEWSTLYEPIDTNIKINSKGN